MVENRNNIFVKVWIFSQGYTQIFLERTLENVEIMLTNGKISVTKHINCLILVSL